jgi:hypothetical protein
MATLDFSFTLIMWRLGPIFSKRNPSYLSFYFSLGCENSPNFFTETIIDLLIVRHKMQTNSVRIHQLGWTFDPFYSAQYCTMLSDSASCCTAEIGACLQQRNGAILLCSLLGDAFPFWQAAAYLKQRLLQYSHCSH